MECGGKRQRDTAFVRTVHLPITFDFRPLSIPKAAWRYRFPPHSKALRASHSGDVTV